MYDLETGFSAGWKCKMGIRKFLKIHTFISQRVGRLLILSIASSSFFFSCVLAVLLVCVGVYPKIFPRNLVGWSDIDLVFPCIREKEAPFFVSPLEMTIETHFDGFRAKPRLCTASSACVKAS